MPRPTKENPKIKWVKKASSWVTTYDEENNGKWKQIQVWTKEKPATTPKTP